MTAAREVGETHPGQFTLTQRSLFELDYLTVPTSLSDHVTTFYHFRCDEPAIRDIQPAAIGHLTLFPYGEGAVNFRDGRRDPMWETSLLTPISVAAPFEVTGPFHAIGAVLSPLGWAALTGLDADAYGNRLLRAGDYLGPEVETFGSRIARAYRAGDLDGEQCVGALADVIGTNLRTVKPRHAALIAQTNNWLSSAIDPDLDDLFAAADYSQRQVQRLVEQYFGLPPSALKRKYRALRAAALMSLPELAPEVEAEVGEAFYDQSHMIREIRLFAGRTPARLSDEDAPFLSEMLDLRNFREITPDGRRH